MGFRGSRVQIPPSRLTPAVGGRSSFQLASFRRVSPTARRSGQIPLSRHLAHLAIVCKISTTGILGGLLMRHLAFFARLALLVLAFAACREASAPALAPVARVLIWPTSALVVANDTIRLRATAYDSSGNELAGREVGWSSKDVTKATLTSTGVVSAKAVGSVEITATVGQTVAKTTIRIVPVPLATHVKDFFTAFSWP